MKVLLLNTSEKTGGAAIACNRLMDALNANGVKAKMLVRDKKTNNPNVVSVDACGLNKLLNKWRFFWERLVIFLHNGFSKPDLFRVSIANTGNDISSHPLVQEADVLHLHWINHGFLSLKDIEKILHLGKPVVWTMHDMWPCTGCCHHSRDCDNYQTQCHNCFFIKSGRKQKDLSYKTFQKKQSRVKHSRIHFVTCSKWLRERSMKSALFSPQNFINIPNPINTIQYIPSSKSDARKKLNLPTDNSKLILFGSAKITDERKGIQYMIETCRLLKEKYYSDNDNIVLVVFGSQSSSIADKVPFKVYPLDYLTSTDKIISLYNAVDLFVTPSLDENLPNTLMEAMACGTPCVGFNTGGIPEMIDHKTNGYVANYKDSEDLADGIHWVLEEADYSLLSQNARKKVKQNYSEAVVAEQYKTLYKQILR